VARHAVNCRADFNPTHLSHLSASLQRWWPSYFHHSHANFHKHEYEKHGSCLHASAAEYFEAALSLQQKYSLVDILTPHPAPTPLASISARIKSHLGVEPMLMCRPNLTQQQQLSAPSSTEGLQAPSTSVQLLVEVGLCFNAAGELRDCPLRGRIRRCSKARDVLLPPRFTFTSDPSRARGG
jgi:hypothetical protein